jgi:hypothetical protein
MFAQSTYTGWDFVGIWNANANSYPTHVSSAATPSGAVIIDFNTKVTGTIEAPGDARYYELTVVSPTVARLNFISSNGYAIIFESSSPSYNKPIDIIKNQSIIALDPGTYYYKVYSPNGTASATSPFSFNFVKIMDNLVESSIAPNYIVNEKDKIVFQTDGWLEASYINGHPIDINYSHWYEDNIAGNYQRIDIQIDGERSDIRVAREDYRPYSMDYLSSTHPYRKVGSKMLFAVTFVASSSSFYTIDCYGTGVYSGTTEQLNSGSVTVLIDPDTGLLVDIYDHNYYYSNFYNHELISWARRNDTMYGEYFEY